MWTMDLHGVDANSAVRIEPERRLTPDEFFEFCQANDGWQIEQTADGEIEIMPPAGIDTGEQNLWIGIQLGLWAERDGRGIAFDSSTGFRLANGAIRSPDASWVGRDVRDRLKARDRKKFARLCPEFVIELVSASDSLPRLKRKMREWMENGAQLGWLIDPRSRTAFIYRNGRETETIVNPGKLLGEPPVDGFVLELPRVWDRR